MSHITELDIEPSSDGQTHIRVGVGARTRLGRLLANEAHTPFEHPRFGKFNSLEGYWSFITAGGGKLSLRASPLSHTVSGLMAQKLSNQTVPHRDPEFRPRICEGLDCKIEQTPELGTLLKDNHLELVRYEYLDGEAVINNSQKWFLAHLETIVKRLQCPIRPTKKTIRR